MRRGRMKIEGQESRCRGGARHMQQESRCRGRGKTDAKGRRGRMKIKGQGKELRCRGRGQDRFRREKAINRLWLFALWCGRRLQNVN